MQICHQGHAGSRAGKQIENVFVWVKVSLKRNQDILVCNSAEKMLAVRNCYIISLYRFIAHEIKSFSLALLAFVPLSLRFLLYGNADFPLRVVIPESPLISLKYAG